jgi:hypothetical protein
MAYLLLDGIDLAGRRDGVVGGAVAGRRGGTVAGLGTAGAASKQTP